MCLSSWRLASITAACGLHHNAPGRQTSATKCANSANYEVQYEYILNRDDTAQTHALRIPAQILLFAPIACLASSFAEFAHLVTLLCRPGAVWWSLHAAISDSCSCEFVTPSSDIKSSKRRRCSLNFSARTHFDRHSWDVRYPRHCSCYNSGICLNRFT